MGACLFVIIGNFGWDGLIFGNSSGIVLDPSRVVAYVVTGIGFLGAGAILKFGTTVRGLTTAASLWVTAAIGVTSAAGEYLVAVLATAMILVSLRPLQWFAGRLRKQTPGTCRLVIESQRPVAVSPIIAELRTAGVGVDALTVRDESGGHQATFTLVCEAGELADMVDTLKAKAPTDAAISLTN
jgi:putative Mg2+ transporter-C (MgtC) family protein